MTAEPHEASPPLRPHTRSFVFFKRALDVIFCVLAAPLLLPLGIFIAMAIRWEAPGAVFLIQRRVSKDGKCFDLIKFRSPTKLQASHATAVSRFLQWTNLDELPRLLNVVHGDMSLVGPRPSLCHELDAYSPGHFQRLEVLPGMTGLAQVRNRSCVSFDDVVKRDLEYILRRSLKLDLQILWWTLRDAV